MTRLPRIFAAALALSVAAIGLTPSNVAAAPHALKPTPPDRGTSVVTRRSSLTPIADRSWLRTPLVAPVPQAADSLTRPIDPRFASGLAQPASQQSASTANTRGTGVSTEGTTPTASLFAVAPSLPAPAAANRTTSPSPVAEGEAAPVRSARSLSSDVGGLITTSEPTDRAKAFARSLVPAAQWLCLDLLWSHESGFRANADNPKSTAFGIAQLLTETSRDYRQQIKRGIAYIASRYGSACAAWAFWLRKGWY